MTQAELATRMEVSASYLAAIEAGRSNPTVGQLANLASAMQVGLSISFVDHAKDDGAGPKSSVDLSVPS
jgi:transcriptional regulator with XRE-family HTH domain